MKRYVYLLRPPGPGCQPKGFVQFKEFKEKKEYKGIYCWGWVEYKKEIQDPEKWDLKEI